MQCRVGVVVHLVDDVVVGSRDEFSCHRSSQHLLDFEGLGLVHERRDSNGSHIIRNGYCMSGGVIAASCAGQR